MSLVIGQIPDVFWSGKGRGQLLGEREEDKDLPFKGSMPKLYDLPWYIHMHFQIVTIAFEKIYMKKKFFAVLCSKW